MGVDSGVVRWGAEAESLQEEQTKTKAPGDGTAGANAEVFPIACSVEMTLLFSLVHGRELTLEGSGIKGVLFRRTTLLPSGFRQLRTLESQLRAGHERPGIGCAQGEEMGHLPLLFSVWGVFIACLIGLLIYNATITRDEEDQLFLSNSNENEHKHQDEILMKVKRVQPLIRVMGSLSALMTLGLAGVFGWDAWTHLQ